MQTSEMEANEKKQDLVNRFKMKVFNNDSYFVCKDCDGK